MGIGDPAVRKPNSSVQSVPTYVWLYYSKFSFGKKYWPWGEDFAKFCGLLRIYELYQKIILYNSDEFVHRKDLTTGADIFHTMIAKKGDANEGGTDFAGQNYFFLPAIDIPLNVLMLFLMSFSRAHRENWMCTFAPYLKKKRLLKKSWSIYFNLKDFLLNNSKN